MSPFMTLLSCGAWQLNKILSKKLKIILLFFVLAYLYLATSFFRFYFFEYPSLYQKEWQYGYRQLVKAIEQNNDGRTAIFISREWGRPAMYYWFYNQTDPKIVQAWNEKANKDQGEYLQFENFSFIDDFSQINSPSGLIAASKKKLTGFITDNPNLNWQLIEEITSDQNEVIWQFYAFNTN
jgi:hypothetical protein